MNHGATIMIQKQSSSEASWNILTPIKKAGIKKSSRKSVYSLYGLKRNHINACCSTRQNSQLRLLTAQNSGITEKATKSCWKSGQKVSLLIQCTFSYNSKNNLRNWSAGFWIPETPALQSKLGHDRLQFYHLSRIFDDLWDLE